MTNRQIEDAIDELCKDLLHFRSLDDAQKRAQECSEKLAVECMGIDRGPNVTPRYKVIRCPREGDEVSMAYNGDYYPDGKIVKISASKRVIRTSGDAHHPDGTTYYRKGQSDVWVRAGGTFCLVPGRIDQRNPEI